MVSARGLSLSPQLGKARGGKHRYLGIFSRAGSPIFQRPITAKSQQQEGPKCPKKLSPLGQLDQLRRSLYKFCILYS